MLKRMKKDMGSKTSVGVAGFCRLPGDCLAKILSLNTTRESCTLSCVSKDVKLAADSDLVWEMFLPSDYQAIVNRSIDPSSILSLRSKKEIYRGLCERPLLIDNGRKTFSLEKQKGKKCFMLAAKDLKIAWSHEPLYWDWVSLTESRFEEVAILNMVWKLEIRGRISTSMLSLDTTYAAYLVFGNTKNLIGLNEKNKEASFGNTKNLIGLNEKNKEASFGIVGNDLVIRSRIGLETARKRVRGDGWFEVELGEFLNEKEAERELEMSLKDTSHGMKKGLILEGIEIRPKQGRM